MDDVFLLLDSFTVCRGSNGIQVIFRSSLHFGTPKKRHYNAFILNFFKMSCRRIIQRTAPQNFVVKLVQLMFELLSSSRRRRPKNAIFLLRSSNLRVHRGTAKFIALIGKTSRRFNELDPENLHRYSMGHYENSYGGGFFLKNVFSRFFGGPSSFGGNAIYSDPSKSKINKKGIKTSSIRFFVMTHRILVQFFRV